MAQQKTPARIQSFDLPPGRRIGRVYQVVRLLGRGWEGEVYEVREPETGIHRAAKLYFPHRDPRHRSIIAHARKLNAMRHCPIVLQYHHTEVIQVARQKIRCMISELFEGMQLYRWVNLHPGRRLRPFRALHVIYHLARGIEAIHFLGEYHSDVHSDNILIQPRGVTFDIKLIDFYEWGRPARYKQQQDVLDTIRVLYECLGGRRYYSRQPPEIRHICANLRSDLIRKRFPTMTDLRRHLENFEWKTLL